MLVYFLVCAILSLFCSYFAYETESFTFGFILLIVAAINLFFATKIMIDDNYFNF
jgi:hypothetical protein